jgi:RHS repeat-associated protein
LIAEFFGFDALASAVAGPVPRTRDSNLNLLRSYIWGLDLSGSSQGAGGVGGLLCIDLKLPTSTSSAGTFFPVYDGNGNILALVDSATGTRVAEYEYGPFGEPLRVTGPAAAANPFRFSTKYTDSETGLLYYGYRYYNSSTRCWIGRDPLLEDGGINLYGFIGNNPIGKIDRLGLEGVNCCGLKEMKEGEALLSVRYSAAKAAFKEAGIPCKGRNKFSCDNVNSRILDSLAPIPQCWKCVMRHGGRENLIGLYVIRDHWVVSCRSLNNNGETFKELIFDYWYDRPLENPEFFESLYPVDLGSEDRGVSHDSPGMPPNPVPDGLLPKVISSFDTAQ